MKRYTFNVLICALMVVIFGGPIALIVGGGGYALYAWIRTDNLATALLPLVETLRLHSENGTNTKLQRPYIFVYEGDVSWATWEEVDNAWGSWGSWVSNN